MRLPPWFRHYVLEMRRNGETVYAFKSDDGGYWLECLQCGYVTLRVTTHET